MSDRVHKFIQESIKSGIDYMFNRGVTPQIDIVRTLHIVTDNRLLEIRIIIYRDIRSAGRVVNDSNMEIWNNLFEDLLRSFIKNKTDERSIKTEFFIHGYNVPIEIQITEDPVVFIDNKIVEKKNEKLEKVIQFIQESTEGKTQKDVTLFIKNYKTEDRLSILDFLNTSDEIIKTKKENCSKKPVTMYQCRTECYE